jgi:hypothetical protein
MIYTGVFKELRNNTVSEIDMSCSAPAGKPLIQRND